MLRFYRELRTLEETTLHQVTILVNQVKLHMSINLSKCNSSQAKSNRNQVKNRNDSALNNNKRSQDHYQYSQVQQQPSQEHQQLNMARQQKQSQEQQPQQLNDNEMLDIRHSENITTIVSHHQGRRRSTKRDDISIESRSRSRFPAERAVAYDATPRHTLARQLTHSSSCDGCCYGDLTAVGASKQQSR